jgi:glycosyltransferase involved in cell wall biosynthesis
MQEQVDILLAIYNGEKYLRKQLDSVLNQTYSNIKIIIRDDGSTDSSKNILEEYSNYTKIKIVKDNLGNLGVTQNFNELVKHSNANYIAFCDQDDIWLPEKIEKSILKIKEQENKSINSIVMTYSDMKVIDKYDTITHLSFWKLAYLHPKYFVFSRLLMQNIPHGCTILMNKNLKEIAFPIPENAILHDHWLSLVVSVFGKSIPIFEPLMLIRNHGENVTQRKNNNWMRLKRFYKNFSTQEEYNKHLSVRLKQANAFFLKYHNQLPKDEKKTLEQFLLLEKTSGWERKMIYFKNKFFRTTFFHTLKMIWRA